MINYKASVKKETYPFPHLIISNFFENKFYNNLEQDFPNIDMFKQNNSQIKRMHFDSSFGDNLYDKLILCSKYYEHLHNYIYSKSFINFFLEIFKEDIIYQTSKNFMIKDILNMSIKPDPYEKKIFTKSEFKKESIEEFLYPRLDLGVGLKNYGIDNGGGGIHVDNSQRIISILFYLGGYKKILGGEHRLWERKGDELKVAKMIEPKPNLLIASLQTNESYHDVKPIENIEGSRNAFYMAISCSVQVWTKVPFNSFNNKYNKNRVTQTLAQKLMKKIGFFKNYV
jgi:hypothetical protein